MIIKRKYTYFWKLCNDDPASKAAYLKAFDNIREKDRQRKGLSNGKENS